MVEIRMKEADYAALEQTLLTRRDVESKAFVLCGSVEAAERTYLTAREVIAVPDSAYVERNAALVVTDGGFVASLLHRCEAEGLSLLEAHTHPWCETPRFSGIDDRSDARKFAATEGLGQHFRHATTVFGGTMRFAGRLWDPALGWSVPVDRLAVIGAPLRYLSSGDGNENALSRRQAEVFDRQIRAIGAAGQSVLSRLTVAVVGAGGLGSQIVQSLALLGVGRLILVDPDRLEASNANRVVGVRRHHFWRHVPKVRALRAGLRALPLLAKVKTVQADVRDPAYLPDLLDADVIVGAVDSASARSFLNAVAVATLTPYVDAGVGIRADEGRITEAGGQVRTVVPGANACLACLDNEASARAVEEQTPEQRALSEEAGYVHGEAIHAPQVAFLNGVVANALVWEIVKLATGCRPTAPYVYYDLAAPSMFCPGGVERREDCVVCGSRALLGAGAAGLAGLHRKAGNTPVPMPAGGGEAYADGADS